MRFRALKAEGVVLEEKALKIKMYPRVTQFQGPKTHIFAKSPYSHFFWDTLYIPNFVDTTIGLDEIQYRCFGSSVYTICMYTLVMYTLSLYYSNKIYVCTYVCLKSISFGTDESI